jgi:hypothetical protein
MKQILNVVFHHCARTAHFTAGTWGGGGTNSINLFIDLAKCGWDLAETRMRATQAVRASDCHCQKSQQSWVQSQHPPAQWNLRGGIWSSVGESIYKKKHNISIATPVTPFMPPPPSCICRQYLGCISVLVEGLSLILYPHNAANLTV